MNARSHRFTQFAAFVLVYNFLVVAWGAFVRASGSGAGCGRHWPRCDGEVVPFPKTTAMAIEYAHRVSSGIALLLVLVLLIAAFRTFAKGSAVRKFASLAMGFMVGEALLGAGLVLFELVAHDASMKRAGSMCLHLLNTFFLMSSIAATWYCAATGRELRIRVALRSAKTLVLGMAALLPVAMSGGIAALGDTLFPSATLREGMARDFSSSAHLYLQLRVSHPFVALASMLLVGALAGAAARHARKNGETHAVRLARAVSVILSVQVALGLANLVLLAPIPLQLAHLLFADALFVAVALLTLEVAHNADRAGEASSGEASVSAQASA